MLGDVFHTLMSLVNGGRGAFDEVEVDVIDVEDREEDIEEAAMIVVNRIFILSLSALDIVKEQHGSKRRGF